MSFESGHNGKLLKEDASEKIPRYFADLCSEFKGMVFAEDRIEP